jgi:hypothetical protein
MSSSDVGIGTKPAAVLYIAKHNARASVMVGVDLMLAGLFAMGFTTGYGVRALRSRRRRYHRIRLPPQVHFAPTKKTE